jgi:hypothetical protein
MVGSIDPRCETIRGTHWPVEVAGVFGTRVAENHLGQRSTNRTNRPDIWMQAIRSDHQKTLAARGPSTYGSRIGARVARLSGTTRLVFRFEFQTDARRHSRGGMRPRFAFRCPSKRGSRECRMRAAPAVSCAKGRKQNAHEHTGQRRTSDIPCAMALRLIPRSPRRRIRLVTVVGELTEYPRPVGPTLLRRLDTSNGCQNHTVLPYATTPFVCAPFGRSRVWLNPKPALQFTCAPDAAASTASHPNVR